MIKQLKEYTIEKGSPFPFDVEEVADLLSWSPRVRCVAVCGEQYRVHEGNNGELTAERLRRIVDERTEGTFTEFVMPVETEGLT